MIALTADATPVERRRCLDGGFSAYMSKPLDYPALLDLIENLCGSSPQKAGC